MSRVLRASGADGGEPDLRPDEKCYRRREQVCVTPVMHFGTRADLMVAEQRIGLSGRLNTSFMEPVNFMQAVRLQWLVVCGTDGSDPRSTDKAFWEAG
jgi:hypothetical protein